MGKKGNSRHQYDISLAISELNKSFSLITDLSQLKNNFVAHVSEIINTKKIHVFMLDPDYNRYYPVGDAGRSDPGKSDLYFTPDEKLIFWLNVNKALLNISNHQDVYNFFTARERHVLETMDAEIIYPFVLMNQVKGFVVLGKKDTGLYTNEELKMLSVLFEQASFAFDNSLLYRQQRERSRKMYRADRMATLGELAAGTAHEIRNPLTSIRSTIQYLQNRIENPQDKSLAEGLISEVDRINDIIQNLLSFAKPGELKIEETDLKDLIDQILNLVENSAKRLGIEISLDCEALTTAIQVDKNLIKQAFINILMNAIQAIENPGGKIQIIIRNIESGKRGSHSDPVFLVEVRDNGPGIPAHLLDKIFDPFYTTKQEGTGLGLSITYSIIHRHDGEIEIQSELGKGTTTRVKLPGKATK
jgi:signal transduction histidine kinase